MVQWFRENKVGRFLFAGAILVSLLLLIVGLQGVEFKSSQPVVTEKQDTDSIQPYILTSLDRAIMAITIMLALLMALSLIPRELSKWRAPLLFCLALFAFLFYTTSLSQDRTYEIPKPGMTQNAVNPTPPANEDAGMLPPSSPVEFHPPQIASWILYLISFVFVSFLLFIGWMIYVWRQSQPQPIVLPPLEEIGEAARLALDDLASGIDGRDAVINCYARMSEVVMRSRNIERGISRTATEFASRLETAGLPGDSVRRLTRLFESVRYGERASQEIEVAEARACLTDIVRFCGKSL